MNTLKVKIPLLMYSETEHDPEDPNSCLIRKMEDLDTKLVHGKEKLRGQGYSWIFDYDTEYSSRGKEAIDDYYSKDKKLYGFNQREVMMDVTLVDGYYLTEFVTEMPLDQKVTLTRDFGDFTSIREMTLKEAILEYLEGCQMELGKIQLEEYHIILLNMRFGWELQKLFNAYKKK